MSTRALVAAAVALVALASGLSPARAQDAGAADGPSAADSGGANPEGGGDSEFEKLMEQGREAYNGSNWNEAIRHYRNAAQRAPERHLPYRNLARAHFQAEQYGRAVVLYDHYLELAPESAKTERIGRERRLASHRAGENVWTKPRSQKRVLEALREALTERAAYTEGGGGAWGLYETLLRTGYLHPDLAHLQTRLHRSLLEEFDRLATPESDQPTPLLTLQEWQLQKKRLEAARSLPPSARPAPDEEDVDDRRNDNDSPVAIRMLAAETALSLLNGRPSEAADRAAGAREANADMEFLRWFELAALVRAERYDDAQRRIESISENSETLSETDRRYLRTLEAILADRRGDVGRAAELYRGVLE